MPESAKGSENWRMTERRPDPDQERAIRHTVGAAQVFAGPGSGKTYVTVHRIKYLIEHHGADPAHILVITFTKAAAQEMQQRFFRLMEPERPPVRFGTFHAVFYHILKHSAQYRGHTIITESEKKRLLRKILRLHRRFACVQEEDMEEIGTCLKRYTDRTGDMRLSIRELTGEDIRFLAEEYEACLREFKQMDFDGVIRHCRALLSEDRELLDHWRRQFTYIMIDEFQDISPDQYEIVRMLAAPENNLFVVGDDDQSIYGFRGASPECMQAFFRDYPEAERMFLNVNYRCGRRIVEAAGKVIAENEQRTAKEIKAFHEEGAGFRLCLFDEEKEEEGFLIRELADRQNAGGTDRCAMICRTHFDCAIWAGNLRKHGIAFRLKERPADPFRHFVVLDIMAYLALANGDMQRRHFLRIMNRPVRYFRRECVPEEALAEEDILSYYQDSPGLQREVRKLFADIRSLGGRKITLQIHYIRHVIGYDRYLSEKYGTQKAAEYIRTADDFQKLSEQFATYGELCGYISRYEETAASNAKEESYDSKEGPGLRLMTMHASKGLEFDTVYLPDCQEGRIPSGKAETKEEIEEERRMLYVAMTRAKKELCMTACKGKSGKDAPSRFLKCLVQSSSSTSSSNSAASRYSSKASATASYSSSSSIYSSSGSSFGSSGFSR